MTIQIDWRTQLADLDRFLTRAGGVVHVCGASQSGIASFCKIIRSRIEKAGGLTLRFGADDHETRSPVDMAAKLYAKLGIVPHALGHNEIISGITAERGDVVVQDVTIEIGDDALANGVRFANSIERIHAQLASRTDKQKVMLLLSDSHEMPTQSLRWFWREFWGSCPSKIRAGSLLVVDSFDQHAPSPSGGDCRPAPDLTIRLPDVYTDEGLAHALEDIESAISATRGAPEAAARAETLVVACEYVPRRVYSALSALLLKLRHDGGS